MKNGWIKLHRQLQDNFLFSGEEFSKGQAFIDLLLFANFKDNKLMHKGEVISLKRGELFCSDYFLAQRWHWSRGKVRRYLALLEKESMISLNRNNRRTIIFIRNYDTFQDAPEPFADSFDHALDTARGTANGSAFSSAHVTAINTTLRSAGGTQHKNVNNADKANNANNDNNFVKKSAGAYDFSAALDPSLIESNDILVLERTFGECTPSLLSDFQKLQTEFPYSKIVLAMAETSSLGGGVDCFYEGIIN